MQGRCVKHFKVIDVYCEPIEKDVIAGTDGTVGACNGPRRADARWDVATQWLLPSKPGQCSFAGLFFVLLMFQNRDLLSISDGDTLYRLIDAGNILCRRRLTVA